jgi:hypothetical protein
MGLPRATRVSATLRLLPPARREEPGVPSRAVRNGRRASLRFVCLWVSGASCPNGAPLAGPGKSSEERSFV